MASTGEILWKMKQRFGSRYSAGKDHAAIHRRMEEIAQRTVIKTASRPIGWVLTVSSFEEDHITLEQKPHGLTQMVPQAHTQRAFGCGFGSLARECPRPVLVSPHLPAQASSDSF